jgi:hypothetical protein
MVSRKARLPGSIARDASASPMSASARSRLLRWSLSCSVPYRTIAGVSR